MEETVSKKSPEIAKQDFCSLVFTFDAYFFGILETETVSFDSEIFASKSSEYIFSHPNILQNYQNFSAYIYRKNPSSLYFSVEKRQSDDNTVYNVYFDSFSGVTSYLISGNTLKFLTFILMPKNSKKTVFMILAFKTDEFLKRCLRNIMFCHTDFAKAGKNLPVFKIPTDPEFIFSSINLTTKLEIYEEFSPNDFYRVTRESKVFKVRKNTVKCFEFILTPQRNFEFCVDRCFGFLYMVPTEKGFEMKIFDDFMFKQTVNNEIGSSYSLKATLGLKSDALEYLNTLADESFFDIKCAADFIIKGVASPIRFEIVFKLKIFPENHKFWLKNFRPVIQEQIICLVRNYENENQESRLVSIITIDGLIKNNEFETEKYAVETPNDDHQSDSYDIILSGTYSYEPDISCEILEEWKIAYDLWVSEKEPPFNVQKLLQAGIPSHMRKNVWLMLVGIYDELPISEEEYQNLLVGSTADEKFILRDVFRTFTCHEFFKENNGLGQQSLFRVCKAYATYDEQVGYCQGMSFIVANFLLHMDELHALNLFVKFMFKLEQRTLFSKSFDELQCLIYVFKRLIQTHIPDLAKLFNDHMIEPQIFATQWFLTVFTSKFPLGMADQCFDMFFTQGQRALLQISVAMLLMTYQYMINFNFEKILNYISFILPKMFCDPSVTKELFQTAYSLNFPPASFEELQMEFQVYKKYILNAVDPYELKKIENRILIDTIMRLEQENSILAHDLVKTKIDCNDRLFDMKQKNEILIKNCDSLTQQMTEMTSTLNELKQNDKLLKDELRKLIKENCDMTGKKDSIIEEYKNICSSMESRQTESEKLILDYQNIFRKIESNCSNCANLISIDTNEEKNPKPRNSSQSNTESDSDRIKYLEMELAIAKMKIAESESENENLSKQISEIQKQKSKKWFEM